MLKKHYSFNAIWEDRKRYRSIEGGKRLRKTGPTPSRKLVDFLLSEPKNSISSFIRVSEHRKMETPDSVVARAANEKIYFEGKEGRVGESVTYIINS